MVVVEDHDGGDNAGGHHEHDAVEIGTCNLEGFEVALYFVKEKVKNRHNMQHAN